VAVHDVGHYRGKELKPGMLFALYPEVRVPEERLYIRVKGTVVVTEEGVANLTREAPLELEDVEALMPEGGLLDQFPTRKRRTLLHW
jgi:Xaa-Pro aminopeptidase